MTGSLPSELSGRLAALTPEKRALLEKALLARRSPSVSRIGPRDRSRPAPLSSSQHRLWFFDQLQPGAPTYNAVLAMLVDGPIDLPILEQAISGVVARHEVLRSVIVLDGDEPVQEPLSDWDFRIELDEAGDLDTAAALVSRWAREPFDLSKDLTLRCLVVALEDGSSLLAFGEHHISFDGWSDEILCREVSTAYRQLRAGGTDEVLAPALQYADYAAWQAERAATGMAGHVEYWRSALAGAPHRTALPIDRTRPENQQFAGRHLEFDFGPELAGRARALARGTGATDFMVLLAAMLTALYRWTGQADLTIGTPTANRNQLEVEDLIGFFSNTVPIRVQLEGSWSFTDVIEAVRTAALGAFEHSELPFERIVDAVAPPRDPGVNPLFAVNVRVQSGPPVLLDLDGLSCRPVHVDLGFSRFDLAIELQISEGGLVGYLEFNEALFEPATATAVIELVRSVLGAAVTDPQTRLWDLSVGGPAAGGPRRRRAAR